jgi:prepilin-type processing-associated H-X9-DG protein
MLFYPMADSSGNVYYVVHNRSMVRNPSQLVLLFDGRGVNCMSSNANRVTLRHNQQTTCNVLIFDGHAETVGYKNLPGQTRGDANAVTPSSNGYLGAFALPAIPYSSSIHAGGLPGGNAPKWRLDQ